MPEVRGLDDERDEHDESVPGQVVWHTTRILEILRRHKRDEAEVDDGHPARG